MSDTSLVLYALAYVASVFTVGRLIACKSLETALAYRVEQEKKLNLWAWLLFPMSAVEHPASVSIYFFDYGLDKADRDSRHYMAILAWIWPAKIVFNLVMGVMLLFVFVGALVEPVVERIFYGPASKCKTTS